MDSASHTVRPASMSSINSSFIGQFSTPKEEIHRKPVMDRPLSGSSTHRSASNSPAPVHKHAHAASIATAATAASASAEVPPFHPNLMINLSDAHNGHHIHVNRSPSLDALKSLTSSSLSPAMLAHHAPTPTFAASHANQSSSNGEYCCQCACHHMEIPRHPSIAQFAIPSRSLPPIPATALSPAHLPGTAPWVFLGGSCDPTTWRMDIAVPKLEKFQIPYYNPQIDDWTPEMIALEAKAKEDCELLLFVIDSKTRAIASMLEATEYIMAGRKVILVILNIPAGAKIDGEQVGERQLKDLNRARAFLCDIAARHQQRCDVFDSVEMAINHIIYSHPSQMKSPRKSVPTPHPADAPILRTPTLLIPNTPTGQPASMSALSLASLSSLSSLSTPLMLQTHSLNTPTHAAAPSPLQHAAQLLSAAISSPSHSNPLLPSSQSATNLYPLSPSTSFGKSAPPVRPSSANAAVHSNSASSALFNSPSPRPQVTSAAHV